MAFLRRTALALVAAVAAAQDQAAPDTTEEKPAPIVCPVRGGGYDDRYAVAQLLILQKNIPQAEACLLEAVQVRPSAQLKFRFSDRDRDNSLAHRSHWAPSRSCPTSRRRSGCP